MDHLQVLESCLKADGVKCNRVSNPHGNFIETAWNEFFYHEGLYKLFENRSEGFTHSHTDASFCGGLYCTYDVHLDRDRMKASISCGGESFEFSIKEIIE